MPCIGQPLGLILQDFWGVRGEKHPDFPGGESIPGCRPSVLKLGKTQANQGGWSPWFSGGPLYSLPWTLIAQTGGDTIPLRPGELWLRGGSRGCKEGAALLWNQGFLVLGGARVCLQKLRDHEMGPPRPCIGGHTRAVIRFRHSEERDVGVSPEETSVHGQLVRSSGRRP